MHPPSQYLTYIHTHYVYIYIYIYIITHNYMTYIFMITSMSIARPRGPGAEGYDAPHQEDARAVDLNHEDIDYICVMIISVS
jgi:hypothetical protein